MHLAIDPEKGAIGIDDDRSIVVQTLGTFLEERRDDHYPVFAGEFLEGLGAGAGNSLGELEPGVILVLAKIVTLE